MNGAQKIIKLDESVVNRIAAGEIIQTPSSALKELIENSLDAHSRNIQITVKSGGTKYLQISDNGTGILRENLPILCERFSTSKLQNYSDLQSINTYGFRGEALASISLVSRLSIQTKTRDQECAFKVKYENGAITEGPTLVAGNQGTIISIEDIFYNNPIRLKTLSLPSEEFQRIFEVTSKYAIHNHQVSFSLKKFNENNSIKTLPSDSPVNIIRTIYGNEVANSLIDINCADTKLKFEMSGFISNGEYSGKKRHFLCFINHRLVESKSIKKAIFDEVYVKILPNSSHPFIYISLEMDPKNIDVNVSPTKHEVNFLNEELIVSKIRETVEEKLLALREVKKLFLQQLLPNASKVVATDVSSDESNKTYAKDFVRVDAKSQKIVKFFHAKQNINKLSQINHSQSFENSQSHYKTCLNESKISEKDCNLTSINELKDEIISRTEEDLRAQIQKMTFVCLANESKALVQCGTILYLCDTYKLSLELFYQRAVESFGNYDKIDLAKPLPIYDIALIGFDMKECCWEESDGPKTKLAEQVEVFLREQRELLQECFNITINSNGDLESLPQLLPMHVPNISYLPIFIIRLATEVDYEEEKYCFKSIIKELASFYAKHSFTSCKKDSHFLCESILYPAIRKNLLPPTKFYKNGTLLKLTCLQQLYKVFERC
ncbi:CLUMA_CG012507, isoform A [Clunio marinus]|uniref:CLUMA_CG012507, isoform A n=1 Tax=Clunio marinus TaxID=568069 RepID=A0A1J1IG07_9DIPT|nr:CLUMA_CG012507, isoform A [Clunio marinus]